MEATLLMAAWTALTAAWALDCEATPTAVVATPRAPVVAAPTVRVSCWFELSKAPTWRLWLEKVPSSRALVPYDVVLAIWSIWFCSAWNSCSLAFNELLSLVAPLAEERASWFIVCRIEVIWLRAPLAVWINDTPAWALEM